ncbi:MAG: 5-(carboxyamino)imidazole ribonucleotide mutase [Endomicrobium sp.]|nr:5-(carboxyamino)imidazole ribonucleotide mutase [Endomicrobium sp.]
MSKNIDIAIIIGSKSDVTIVNETIKILDSFCIKYSLHIASAHRTPHYLLKCIKTAENLGVKVFIAAAGMSAALPGVIASSTLVPVIGIPLASENFVGLDSLLSIVQMPKGIPVATVAVGKAGAINAAILAIQILNINKSLTKQLKQFRSKMTDSIINDNLQLLKLQSK